MRESVMFGSLNLPKFIILLVLRCLLMALLHLNHVLLHSLKKLCLYEPKLFKGWGSGGFSELLL
jgi:hypothetical protein